jgi:hypothetical protein
VICSSLLTEDPEILGATVQNLVALAPGICAPLVQHVHTLAGGGGGGGGGNYLIPVIAAEMKTIGSGLQRLH